MSQITPSVAQVGIQKTCKKPQYTLLAANVMAAGGWAIFLGSWMGGSIATISSESFTTAQAEQKCSLMLPGLALAQLGLIGIAIASEYSDDPVCNVDSKSVTGLDS